MLKEFNKDQKEFDFIKLRKAAKKYALGQVESQKKQFESLSLLTNFNNYYITLDNKYEAKQLEIFKKMAMDGLIFKTLKPVY
jgi:isoleucyl-tRNA synthetase